MKKSFYIGIIYFTIAFVICYVGMEKSADATSYFAGWILSGFVLTMWDVICIRLDI